MPAESSQIGFDVDYYFTQQMGAFREHLAHDAPNIIEFGGKPFGDYHASRVLPGYEPDIKADILRCLIDELGDTRMAFVVNARDIIGNPDGRRVAKRIRGDSQLTYDDEVIRIAHQAANDFDLEVTDAVISVVPPNLCAENADYLEGYQQRLSANFEFVHMLPMIDGYPNDIPPFNLESSLTQAPPISSSKQNLIVMSPGGGSGKFGVAIAEIAHHLRSGTEPNFIKFETFPVFNLPPDHCLNQAFLAATADLPNVLTQLNNGQTNYDKDIQNLNLLKQLLGRYPDIERKYLDFVEPTDMGVNVIETAITSDTVVKEACRLEIERRIARYRSEVGRGVEDQATVLRTVEYAGALALDSSEAS